MPTSISSGRSAAAKPERRPAGPGPADPAGPAGACAWGPDTGACPWGPGIGPVSWRCVCVTVMAANLGQTQVYVKPNFVSDLSFGYRAGMAPGLRERRKQETRQAISDIATHMFVEHGFDEVTIAQVADAAGVAKMTVTNYFPRKEDLVFDRAEAVVHHMADVIAARAPGESMLAAIRRDYAAAVARADVTLGLSTPGFAGMILSSPVLVSRAREMVDQRERALGDAIAAETGIDNPQQRLVAALLASAHRVLAAEATQRSLAGQSREEICAVLADASARAFDLLEPSLGSYGIRARSG